MHRLMVVALATMILAVGCDNKIVSPKRTLGVASVSATGEIAFSAPPKRCEEMFSMGYAIITVPAGVTGTAEVQCGGTTLTGASCTVTGLGSCTATGDLTRGEGVFGCNFTTTPSGSPRSTECLFDL